MTNGEFKEIIQGQTSELSEIMSHIFHELLNAHDPHGNELRLDVVIPGGIRSLLEILNRIRALNGLIAGIEMNGEALLIPDAYLSNILSWLREVKDHFEEIASEISNFESHGGIGEIDDSAFTLRSGDGSRVFNVAESFVWLENHMQNGLEYYWNLASITRSNGFLDFSSSLEQLSKIQNQIYEIKGKLVSVKNNMTQELKSVKEASEESSAVRKEIELSLEQTKANSGDFLGEIERIKGESEKDRKTIAEYEASATLRIQQIEETAQEANQLKTMVENYKNSFDSFDEKMEERNETITKGQEKQDQLIVWFKEQEQEIDRLMQKSEDMLKGATVAGLASSFGETRDKLEEELNNAKVSFHRAIVFLCVLTLPLLLALFPIPFLTQFYIGNQEGEIWSVVGKLISRGVFLIPGIWLTKFAAARHQALFKLREDYVYKYSLASSVEGFKKQAEEFSENIAAAIFAELTFNPADKMDSKSHAERVPNPVLEKFYKKLGLTHDGKPDAG